MKNDIFNRDETTNPGMQGKGQINKVKRKT